MIQSAHGGNIYKFQQQYGCIPVDFSANINPLGMPASAQEAYLQSLPQLERYPDPDCRALIQALAAFEQVKEETLLCGNGAADLIYRLMQAIKPKKALLIAPTFSEYEQALRSAGAVVDFLALSDETGFVVTDELLQRVAGHEILVLCNPNNPTGVLTSKSFLKRLLTVCEQHGCLLLLDECFMDFTDGRESLMTLLRDPEFSSPCLVLLKAFTKTFAMPGLRLGYCLSRNRELLEEMAACGPCWNVSVPAMNCGIAALNETGFLEKTHRMLYPERQRLIDGVTRFGGQVYGSHANYIFFRHRDEQLYQTLCDEGILIRDCRNYRGLAPGFYRIAVRTKEENDRLLATLNRLATGE